MGFEDASLRGMAKGNPAGFVAVGYHNAMLTLRQLAEALQAEYVPSVEFGRQKDPSQAESVERVASVRNADPDFPDLC